MKGRCSTLQCTSRAVDEGKVLNTTVYSSRAVDEGKVVNTTVY